MHTPSSRRNLPVGAIVGITFLSALALLGLAWRSSGLALPVALAAALLAGLSALGVGGWAQSARLRARMQAELHAEQEARQQSAATLESLLRLDGALQAASSEKQILQAALGMAMEMSGARGASFVPLDEWGQALPATTVGQAPAQPVGAWEGRLESHAVRSACRVCRALSSETGTQHAPACPLADNPIAAGEGVHCLRVQRGARLLGMVNLYAPSVLPLPESLARSLQMAMNEAAVRIENARFQQREAAVLQQGQALRSLHAPRTDLSALLGALLESLQQAVGADGARLVAQTSIEAWLPPVSLSSGQAQALEGAQAEALVRDALLSREECRASSAGQQLVGAPLLLAGEERALGVLLLAGAPGFLEEERKHGLLQPVAGQAALLIENERALLALEYRTVMQERARLAREIHDGLAQTLAFLKLQAAQMQSQLAQGNLGRLGHSLAQHYAALSDGYLEARQAIDNLRFNPQQGLVAGLELLLDDLRTRTGLTVERAFSPISRELPPEVQIQVVRIVQEALSNVRKHAHAEAVTVLVREWNGDVVIEVRDDGQGFQPDEVPGGSQYGLRGMRERAELIGADFQVISGARQGTCIRLSIPLQPQETPL